MKELGVFKQMVQLAYLPIYHKLLTGAMELDIFTKLTAPKTAEELAEQEGWNSANTGYLLGALSSIAFIKYEDGKYVNTAETSKYLSADSPEYAGGFLMTYIQEGFAPMDVNKEGPQSRFESEHLPCVPFFLLLHL